MILGAASHEERWQTLPGPALPSARGHSTNPPGAVCRCTGPVLLLVTRRHARLSLLESRRRYHHISPHFGEGIRDREWTQQKGSPPLSLLLALQTRWFCHGMGHHVTLQIRAIAIHCHPAMFPDVVPIATSAWNAMGSCLGNAARSLGKGRKQIFRI